MTDDEIIAVVQAHKDGKQIEMTNQSKNQKRTWWNLPNYYRGEANWDFWKYDYRVKPEPLKPREWWIHKHVETGWVLSEVPKGGWLHVREVIEE